MKKLLILALSACVLFTACQATPKNPIVVNKDSDRVVELAQDESAGIKADDMEVLENYVFELDAKNLSVVVDAEVTVQSEVPTARVSSDVFSQEMVTAIFNYLYPVEKPTEQGSYVETKEDIEEGIIFYKQLIAEGRTNEQMMSVEEAEEWIAQMESRMGDAPYEADVPQPKISDGTFFIGTQALTVMDDISNFTVYSPTDDIDNSKSYLHYSRTDFDDPYKDYGEAEELSVSFEEAMVMCDEFFAAAGVSDVSLSHYIETTYGDSRENVYEIYFTRTVNSFPAAYIQPGMGFDGSEEFMVPWEYEQITINVGNDGIYDISWTDKTITTGLISQDTGVISFEEATAIFEDMVGVVYGYNEENPEMELIWSEDEQGVPYEAEKSYEITVNEVKLAPVRIWEKNSTNKEGIYTPSWVFYGTGVDWGMTYSNGYGERTYKTPVMVINAIDGSLIDISKGY